jgi:hypothetical protein
MILRMEIRGKATNRQRELGQQASPKTTNFQDNGIKREIISAYRAV